uniref:Myosin-binding protein C, fast-type n=1 Tax=Scleropages formosus TaxID=113540 RepID=A0A8D0CJF0_SCLFO
IFHLSEQSNTDDALTCVHLLSSLAATPGTEPEMTELSGLFVEKPQSTIAIKGKDITFVAKVDSSTLLRKPALKWLKGKWLDLGSKAGKHLQFKESYDRDSKIYTYEMKIVKVVDGDAGGYRCEVTAKDKCDSCTFDITVEGRQDKPTLSSSSRGEAGEDEGELDFSGLLKKRSESVLLLRQRMWPYSEEVDVWSILKKAKPCDYEKIAFQYGITDLRGMLKRLKKMKVEPKKCDAFLKKLEAAYSVDKGKKIQLTVEVANPDAQIKWLKNGTEIKPSAKYVFESVGNKRKLTINKCTLADDAAYECVIGEDKSFTEVFVKEPPVTITKLLDDLHVVVEDKVEFEVEVSEEGANVKWMKDGVELARDGKYRFKKDGKKHWLIINEASKEDIGMYYVFTNGGESKAELEVEDKELEVLQSIADLTVKAAEQAIFKCEVSDEKVTGKWYKDGVEVKASNRIKMVHIGRIHKLTIDDVKAEDAGDYTFVPDGYALSLSAKLNFLEIKIDYVPRQDPPKIHLDTTGSMVNKNTIIVVAGNKLRLDVEISGEPAPTVCWTKGDNVRKCCGPAWVITETEGRVRVDNRKTLSSFVIEGAERGDEGRYTITVTNPAGEDKAELFIKVVDVPDPPEGVKCMGVGEDTATIIWEPPKFDGGSPIKGYLMERKKVGSSRWTKLNFDIYESTSYEAKKMIEGVLYEMRVFAVNGIGVSQPSCSSKPFMPIGIIGDNLTFGRLERRSTWSFPSRSAVARGLTGRSLSNECPQFQLLPRQLEHSFTHKHTHTQSLLDIAQGKPRPVVNWFKDDEPLDPKKVSVRTTEVDTILFIRSAERDHSGTYTLSVQIENMEDKASFEIRVVEKPGPPLAVRVTDVWGFNAALEWKPPKDNGNSDISGYIIQKADKKTKEWFMVYEHNRRPNCTVSDLVMGNEYVFRIFSENICGLSDEAGLSKNTAVIAKTGLAYNRPPYKEKDLNTSPKFTQPLQDRSVIAGYSTAISCSVRGRPKPKIIWMKNKTIIGEDPKYLMQNNQGVLTLHIRKPSLFDGGNYSCKAVNELGEDVVECKLEVRALAVEKENKK